MSETSTRTLGRRPADTTTGRLIVLRHGQTSWNANGRFQGQADPGLDETGVAQAARAATELSAVHPDAIISSDLWRAAQTAEAVGRACGLGFSLHTGLREQALGGWEGLTPAAAASMFPEQYIAWAAGTDVRRGGGESEAEAGRRALAALLPVLRRCQSGMTLVVVSHGLVIRGMLRHLDVAGNFGHPIPVVHLANGRWISLRPRP